MAKPQSVLSKRADLQARSGSFWFLVVGFSLGSKQLGGYLSGRLDGMGYFVGLAIFVKQTMQGTNLCCRGLSVRKRRKRGRKVGSGGLFMKKHSMDWVERGRWLLLAGGRSVFCRHACVRAVGVLLGRWLETAELAKELRRRLAVAES